MNNYEKILSELNAIQIIEFKEYLSNNIPFFHSRNTHVRYYIKKNLVLQIHNWNLLFHFTIIKKNRLCPR